MNLTCIASGSNGNCYILEDMSKRKLMLDLGVSKKTLLQAIDFDTSSASGALVTHRHLDHARSLDYVKEIGIKTYAPYQEQIARSSVKFDDFTIRSFPLTDQDGKFCHTDADGGECPCYGFLIHHSEIGKMLYITDTEYCKWRFKGINHILISCNYDKKYLPKDDAKRNHVLRGHMELGTVADFIRVNQSEELRTVILCHLSGDNAVGDEMASEIKKITGGGVYVDYAKKGKQWNLKNPDSCPF